MRLVFAGTPAFAERALAALLAAGHEIACVLTRADKPAGRGRQMHASPVKALALAHGLPVMQPRTLRDAQAQRELRAIDADAMVVAAYGLILPAEVLAWPRHGCLNIHASLLPRWRGAAPIQRAIEAGDACSGITIMQMDAGLDTGAMLLARSVPIGPEDTGGTLHDRLAALGAELVVEALARLAAGTLVAVPQPDEGVTYARKIEKADEVLDWSRPARALADQVRAFDPFPGCSARLERVPEVTLKIWRLAAAGGQDAVGATTHAGTVVGVGPAGIRVACGDGSVWLCELQRPGGRRLPAAEFVRGFEVRPGDRLV